MTRPLTRLAVAAAALVLAAQLSDQTATAQLGFQPIELKRDPGSTSVTSWPVTFGVPFRQGDLQPGTQLGVVDDQGRAIPAQIERVARWSDQSVRWLRVSYVQPFTAGRRYYLQQTQGSLLRSDDIVITGSGGTLTLRTKRLQLAFKNGAFPEISLETNGNGTFDPDEILSDKPGDAFYARFTDGRTATLRNSSVALETPAPGATDPVRYAVVKVEGNYVDDVSGAVLAKGTVYYHVDAGDTRFRLDHKFIFTRHGSGIRELGIRVPVSVTSSTAVVEATPGSRYQTTLGAGSALQLVQADYRRFNETSARCNVRDQGALQPAAGTCGNWADLSGTQTGASSWGLAVQVPGFAEQFPKAFEIGERYVQTELWSTKEGAMELNFNSDYLLTNYFGQWMANAPASWRTLVSANGGVGKTHEVWFYPHAGGVNELDPAANMGATTKPPIAYADLDHVAASGVFGPFGRKVPGQFDATEAALEDYFDRIVFVSRRVFPPNGFLLYGMHPYVGQGWDESPWRPNVSAGLHESRLSWSFDYNLRRALFPLWIRTGDRRFYDYARPHARFSHDLQFSNADAGIKPKGWIVLGAEDPPFLWGSFAPTADLNRKPRGRFGNASVLASAGADDVAQLVQAYFLTADFHARDMVESWKSAVATEMADPVDPLDAAEVAAGERPDALIRVLGSAYELGQEPWLKNFADAILAQLRPSNPTVDNFVTGTNYAKAADVFGAFYWYYVATGSQVAKDILLDRAYFGLRYGWRDRLFTRHSADLVLSGALAAAGGDKLEGIYLRRMLVTYGNRRLRLAGDLQMSVDDFGQSSTADWQHRIITEQVARSFGVPAVMQGMRTAPGNYPDVIPIRVPEPTDPVAITFEHTAGSMTSFEFTVNLDGGDAPNVELWDVAANQQRVVWVQTRYSKRLTLSETADSYEPWYLNTGSVASVSITVSPNLPSGQYRLTLGEHVSWRLLYHTAGRLVLEAPRGLPIVGFEDYYFKATGTGQLPIYAYRPVEVQTKAGEAVPLQLRTGTPQPDGGQRDGLYKIDVVAGTIYRIRSVPSALEPIDVDTPKDNIVRFDDVTLAKPVFAVGSAAAFFEPTRLFDLSSKYDAVGPVGTCAVSPCSAGAAGGREGTALAYHVWDRMLETPQVTIDNQLEQGSVSFWMRPEWEPSRRAKGNPLLTTLFQLGPISLWYTAVNDVEGNGTLKRAYLNFHISDGLTTNGNDGTTGTAINVPARHWLIGGRWYHIAVVWDLDGQDAKVELFVDGRLKVQYALIQGAAVPHDAALTTAAVAPAPVRIGSDNVGGEHQEYGTTVDEVRVYRGICYAGDFVPGPSTTCATPMLYAGFDGASALSATLDGQTVALTPVNVG